MYVLRFEDVRGEVGEKAGNLATLFQKRFPVPDGFIVTQAARERSFDGMTNSIPEDVLSQLKSAYEELSFGKEINEVKGIALDLIKAGRGQARVAVRGEGYSRLNVKGFLQLQEALKDCWSHTPQGEIIIQKMLESEKTGVIMPDVGTGDKLIESSWGMTLEGDPDTYIIRGDAIEEQRGEKLWFVRTDSLAEKAVKDSVPPEKRLESTLSSHQVATILNLSTHAEQALGGPGVLEFAFERGKPAILQSRRFDVPPREEKQEEGEVLSTGRVVVPGKGEGHLRIIASKEDLEKVTEGDVLLAQVLLPELLDTKASAILTKTGSIHRLRKILNVPTLKVRDFSSLSEGERVLVDAVNGQIIRLAGEKPQSVPVAPGPEGMKLKTVLSSVGNVPQSEGMIIRSENILEGEYQDDQERVKKILSSLESLARQSYPKPVFYVAFDGRTDEQGDDRENNPLLGWHGVRRRDEFFKSEIQALKELSDKALNNVFLLLPFVSSPEELRSVREMILFPLKVGIMVETPSSALEIEEFCREGIYAVVINLDTLIQLTEGKDIDDPRFSSSFSQLSPGVKKLVENVAHVCKQYRVEVTVKGEACNNPETLKFLSSLNVISLASDQDGADSIREFLREKSF